jgi:hypothetical protein
MGTGVHPVEGAGIRCHVCGARPFAAAWGLPQELECFDLVNGVDDLWGCPAHRVKREKAKSTHDQLAAVLEKLKSHAVTSFETDADPGEAWAAVLEMVAAMSALTNRLRGHSAI